MGAVAVELGPLAEMQRVFDGQRVQAELLAQHGQVVRSRGGQVQPDGDGLVRQVVADVGDRESLELELAVPVQPGTRQALGGTARGDGGGHLQLGFLILGFGVLRARGVPGAGRRFSHRAIMDHPAGWIGPGATSGRGG
jgi:hypothetical protein